MITLIVLSILGILTYRGLSEISQSQQVLSDTSTRWRSIGKCLKHMDREFFGLIAPKTGIDPTSSETGNAPIVIKNSENIGQEIHFLRLDEGFGVMRVAYRLRNQKLEWIRWRTRTGSDMPEIDELLGNVKNIRWQFVYAGRVVNSLTSNSNSPVIPEAVVLQLDLLDQGLLTRIIALK